MSEVNGSEMKRTRGLGRRIFWGVALIAGALILSSPFLVRHNRHHRVWDQAASSPDQMREEIGNGVHWALWKVDATDAQRTQVNTILDDLAPDLFQLQSEHQALQTQIIQVLEADEINPDEVAEIQTASLSLSERVFSRSIDSLLQVSAVLSPVQRKELLGAWRERR